MKRITATMKIASLVLAVGLFTGCSVTNTANDTPGASGGAVSGSVASEEGKEELAVQKRSYLENSDNRYDISYGDDYNGVLIQYRLDGTLVKKSKTEIEDIEWVTDEWLYYRTENEKTDMETLWRIPIKKTEKGDQLLTDKKEKVLKLYSMQIEYVTDSYIIMDIYQDGDAKNKKLSGICKYDLKTGKLTELISKDEEADSVWGSEYPLMWEGNLLFEGYEKLYILNPEKEHVSSCYSFGESEYLDDGAITGNEFYFLVSDKLYRYNFHTKKTECVISDKKFLKAVQNLNLGNIKSFYTEEMYLNQGRVYFCVEIEWTKKKGSEQECHYNKDELFSVSLDDPGKIRHEDKLMDYLDQKGKFRKYSYGTGWSYYSSICIEGFVDGKVLASYSKRHDGEDYKYRYVLYDIQSGEIQDMAEKALPEEYEDYII